MMLDLFKSFLAVAEAGTFKQAAALLHVSQPTLSRQISRLENELGTQLFERYGRHVECTASGQFLRPLARAIIARTEETVSLMREHAGAGLSAARLGATGMVFAHLLAPILTTFIAACPNVRLDLIEREDSALEDAVLEGELDCAVTTLCKATRAARKHLLTEEIFLVVASDHPLAGKSVVSLKLLRDESILLPTEQMNASRVLVDAFRQAGFEPRCSLRVNYPELLKKLVAMHLGVTLLPTMLVAPDTMKGLAAVPLEERIVREVILIYSWDRPLPIVARALMTHIETQTAALSAQPFERNKSPDRSRRPRRDLGKIHGFPVR